MMDWTDNQPNARYWTLKLIKDSFHAGDRLVETSIKTRDVAAQGFVTKGGRRLLLANERNHAIDVELPDAEKASALTVDADTGDGPARSVKPADGKITLEPFAVMVVNW
jgi:hypothetical protein